MLRDCTGSIQLTGLCRVYSVEYYFENLALYNITRAEPGIVQCLYLFKLGAPNFEWYFIYTKRTNTDKSVLSVRT